jgi:HD domain
VTEREQLLEGTKLIKNELLNGFVLTALGKVPETFWTIAASSTGKYHPEQSNGEGGLVRHVLATLYFARELFICYSCTQDEQDIINAAIILHDVGKAIAEPHDIVAATTLRWLYKDQKLVSPMILAAIDGVRWHMGKWATGSTDCQEDEQGRKSFPDNFTRTSMIVHLADYAASRKRVNLTKLEA